MSEPEESWQPHTHAYDKYNWCECGEEKPAGWFGDNGDWADEWDMGAANEPIGHYDFSTTITTSQPRFQRYLSGITSESWDTVTFNGVPVVAADQYVPGTYGAVVRNSWLDAVNTVARKHIMPGVWDNYFKNDPLLSYFRKVPSQTSSLPSSSALHYAWGRGIAYDSPGALVLPEPSSLSARELIQGPASAEEISWLLPQRS
jgi:hypothetical protein